MKFCLCFLISIFSLSTLSANVTDTLLKHPFLIVNNQNIERIKNEIAINSTKEKAWQVLKENADKFLYQPLDIPPRGGNWEQYYISPKTGKDLVRGKQIGNWQWQHIDTSTNKTLVSNSLNAAADYDGVVISLVHDTWAIAAMQLGLAYKISGNKFYANKAKDILLAYAT